MDLYTLLASVLRAASTRFGQAKNSVELLVLHPASICIPLELHVSVLHQLVTPVVEALAHALDFLLFRLLLQFEPL